mgnify:CR=1 FL=1
MDSKAAAKDKTKLQVAYHDPTLSARLAEDIKRSSFSTRPKYVNALLEKVLSLPTRTSTSSHIDELFAWVELLDTLPIERIWQLAPTQNRNFDQMLKHLLEIALSYYPENSQTSAVVSDMSLHKAEASLPGLADYTRLPDTTYRLPAARNPAS